MVMEEGVSTLTFDEILESRGVSRRSFLKLCASIAAATGIAEMTVPRVAHAIEESVIGAVEGSLYPVIWIEGGSCTGCTEAFTQLEQPNIEQIVLELVSLNYSETLSAGAGSSLELAKDQTIQAGNYILIYEGAVNTAQNGEMLRTAGETGEEILLKAAPNATVIIAAGSCAVNGGWMAAIPNPSGAMGVQQFLLEHGIDKTVVNIPSCPVNNEWLFSTLVDMVVMKDEQMLKERLNMWDEPSIIFDQTVHENCERRGHFEAGEFVYFKGSKEESWHYCLYAIGCRGPLTRAICGITQYNNHTSWCIASGGPCIGCCEADPLRVSNNWVECNVPFYQRQRDWRIGDWAVAPWVIAVSLTGILAGVLVIHGFGMKLAGRIKDGPTFEKVRVWDAKHPDRSIGDYNPEDMREAVAAVQHREAETPKERMQEDINAYKEVIDENIAEAKAAKTETEDKIYGEFGMEPGDIHKDMAKETKKLAKDAKNEIDELTQEAKDKLSHKSKPKHADSDEGSKQ